MNANMDYEDRPSDLDEQDRIDADNLWDSSYLAHTYSGAPNECSIHWPTKLVEGFCPVLECPWSEARQNSEHPGGTRA